MYMYVDILIENPLPFTFCDLKILIDHVDYDYMDRYNNTCIKITDFFAIDIKLVMKLFCVIICVN